MTGQQPVSTDQANNAPAVKWVGRNPKQVVERSNTVITVRMKQSLKARLDQLCKANDVSLNMLSVTALTEFCDRLAPVPKISEEQASKLAAKLVDTCGNIYRLAELMFPGVEFGDTEFALVEKVGEIFRCEGCNRFQDVALKHPDYSDKCYGCVAEDKAEDGAE